MSKTLATTSPYFNPARTPYQCVSCLYDAFLFMQCNGTEHAAQLAKVISNDYAELAADGQLFAFIEDLKREAVRNGIALESCILTELSAASLVLGEPLPQTTRTRLNQLTSLLWAWVVRLDGQEARAKAATGTTTDEASAVAKPRKQGIPKDEAARLVRDYLLKHATTDPFKVTIQAVVSATGVSIGAVCKSDPWRAFQERRKVMREDTGTLRTIPLTPEMLATIPVADDRDEELSRLIAEQQDDDEADNRRRARRERSRRS